ncbi:S-adenosyl-L-methionine-dependent methyltransferase [Mycena sp. CBHHK59/15]|nr:S-adenosyl-L-methionine-dependent methyltransferase [Mycena sp. CBHHK59/15]
MSSDHSHSHHSFAHANQAHFDQHAHHVDHLPTATELAESVYCAILKAYPFDKDSTMVMDYACGTVYDLGIVSRGIAPHCKALVGVDISQGMVDEFNKGVEINGIPTEKMRAIRAELKGEEPELDGNKFDVVMCSLAYHHFEDIVAVTRTLAFFLKPSGVLLIVDFPTMDAAGMNVPEDIQRTIAHKHGIPEAAIQEVYAAAGLEDVQLVFFKGPKSDMHPEDIFVASGVKR